MAFYFQGFADTDSFYHGTVYDSQDRVVASFPFVHEAVEAMMAANDMLMCGEPETRAADCIRNWAVEAREAF